jgi:hypothetical protein
MINFLLVILVVVNQKRAPSVTQGSTLKTISVTKNSAGHWCLSGVMDDQDAYEEICADGENKITIDLRDIKSITSHGIRVWTQYLEKMKFYNIELMACSAIFLDSVDMVVKMAPKSDLTTIKSCSFDYYCKHCDKSVSREFPRQDLMPIKLDLLTSGIACPRCHLPMEPEDQIESYIELFLAALGA